MNLLAELHPHFWIGYAVGGFVGILAVLFGALLRRKGL